MKKEDIQRYIGTTLSLFCAAALSLLLFFVLYRINAISKTLGHIAKTLMPFIIGAILAYIIRPLCNKLDNVYFKTFKFLKDEKKRKNLASSFSVFTGIVTALIVIYILIIIIVPNLITSIIKLVQILPSSADKVARFASDKLNQHETLLKYSQQIVDTAYKYVEDFLKNNLLNYAQNFATGLSTGVISIFVLLFNTLIGFIVATYLLLARKKLAKQGKLIVYSLFKKDTADSVMEEVKYADNVFSGFINGKILDAVVISILCYIILMLFKIANPDKETMSEILISVIVGVFNIIPFFGWYIAWFIGALLALIVNPMQALFFFIFDFILQQIDGNIIGPKIIGNTTGISSFWVLFAILLFGDIWGFFGMLVGVPLFAIIYHFIKKLVFRGLERNGAKEMGDEYEAEYKKEQ